MSMLTSPAMTALVDQAVAAQRDAEQRAAAILDHLDSIDPDSVDRAVIRQQRALYDELGDLADRFTVVAILCHDLGVRL